MIHNHPDARRERPLSELFNELLNQISLLMRQEWQLARAEMSQKVRGAGKAMAMLAVGGAVVYAGFLALVAALIIAIANALAWWLSALIVGVVVLACGGALIYYGFSMLRRGALMPERTVETLRDDARWLKEETR
jgi:fatty acid desaturase